MSTPHYVLRHADDLLQLVRFQHFRKVCGALEFWTMVQAARSLMTCSSQTIIYGPTCRLEVESSEVCFVLCSCFAAQLLSAGIVSPVSFTSKAQNYMVWVSVKQKIRSGKFPM